MPQDQLYISKHEKGDFLKEFLFFSYIAVISTISVVLCVYDKIASKHARGARIRERTLCLCGALGGALAMLLTMTWIRHKTQHTWMMVLMGTASLIWTLIYLIVFLIFVI